MTMPLNERAAYRLRQPREHRGRPAPSSSAAAWAERTIANLELALQLEPHRQRLQRIIWQIVGGDLVDLLHGSILRMIRDDLAADRLVMLRRSTPGVRRYELDCLNERFRDKLKELVLSLIEDELLELIAVTTAPKKRGAKKG